MNLVRATLLAGMAGLLAACGGNDTCEDVQEYELAEQGERLAVPPDLNEPDVSKEMKIPETSDRPPRPAGAGCLDKPPGVLKTG